MNKPNDNDIPPCLIPTNIPELNDAAMRSALLAKFKPREDNPVAYDKRMSFWSDLIQRQLKETGLLSMPMNRLVQSFCVPEMSSRQNSTYQQAIPMDDIIDSRAEFDSTANHRRASLNSTTDSRTSLHTTNNSNVSLNSTANHLSYTQPKGIMPLGLPHVFQHLQDIGYFQQYNDLSLDSLQQQQQQYTSSISLSFPHTDAFSSALGVLLICWN